ncbi:MAG: VOC family protein [bacterium]
MRWSHAVMYVCDADEMIGFYRDMLGFEVSDHGPVMLGDQDLGVEVTFLSQVATDHHQLAFVPVRGDGASNTYDHMAFRVDSLAEVKELAARLQDDGRATGVNAMNHGNAWSVYFKDPDGNGVEVFCDSPFHVQQPQARPWDFAMSEDELRRVTEEQFGGEPEFKPADEFYAERRRHFGD